VTFYSRLQTTVKRLIASYGETAILRVMDSAALPDSAQPWLPAEITGVDYTVKIVFIPDKLDNHEEIMYLKDTEIISGQINGYMAVTPGVIPKAKDVVVRGSQLLTIDNIMPLNPGGIDLLFKFEFGA
tara:strand:- start:601 stop:984 length:384 start_codon:yes stop_codon:yes gene_type:complete